MPESEAYLSRQNVITLSAKPITNLVFRLKKLSCARKFPARLRLSCSTPRLIEFSRHSFESSEQVLMRRSAPTAACRLVREDAGHSSEAVRGLGRKHCEGRKRAKGYHSNLMSGFRGYGAPPHANPRMGRPFARCGQERLEPMGIFTCQRGATTVQRPVVLGPATGRALGVCRRTTTAHRHGQDLRSQAIA